MPNIEFFKDCLTVEEIKRRYRDLAKQNHPDLGGSTAEMQTINAAYFEAMRRVIAEETDAFRQKQAAAGFEPLREAIEFAVTLPSDVLVTIRGFWLWLEGNTRQCKDRIKAFKSTDGKKFCWSPNKTAWYFAAVPSSNRGKVFTFEEIEAIYGREEINTRRQPNKIAA